MPKNINVVRAHFFQALKLILAGVLVWLLVRTLAWSEVLALLRNAQYWWLLPYAVVVMVGNALSVLRWQSMIIGTHVPRFWTLFCTYITASFINNFLPGFVGGDTYRAYRLRRTDNMQLYETMLSVVADRATGLLGILLLAAASGTLWIVQGEAHPLTLLMVVATAVLLIVGLFFAHFRVHIISLLSRFIPRKKYRRYAELIERYTDGYIMRGMAWGVLFGLVGVGGANYVLFLTFNVEPPFLPYLFLALLSSVVASLPISIGNIGIKEWAYITLFSLIGVSAPVAVAVVITGRVMQALISLAGVPFYFTQSAALHRECKDGKGR